MLNNLTTLLSVVLPSVVSILTICVPALLNKQNIKMKEIELNYQNKIQAYSDFSEKFSALMLKNKVFESDYFTFHTATFKAMIFSSPQIASSMEQLLNLIEIKEFQVDTEIMVKFMECLRLISEELNPNRKKGTSSAVPPQKHPTV